MSYCTFLPYMKCPYKDKRNLTNTTDVYEEGQHRFSFIRFLHASPNTPNLDIYIDNKKAITNLPYGGLAGYAAFSGEPHKYQVYIGGQTTKPLLTIPLSFSGDSFTTIAIAGLLQNLQYRIYRDMKEDIPANESYLRFVHLSPNTPGVDVIAEEGIIIFKNLTFGKTEQYKKINPNIYKLFLSITGTSNIILGLPQLTFEGGKAYTIYSSGLLNGTPPLSAMLLTDGLHRGL